MLEDDSVPSQWPDNERLFPNPRKGRVADDPFLCACLRRRRVIHPCCLGRLTLGLQHLSENAERVSSDNLGYISFG